MPPTDLDVALFGASRDDQNVVEGHAGPVTFQFTDLSLRHIRLGDVELARRIYFAARGADWDTVHPIEVRDLRIQATRRTFKAEWVARCRGGEVDYEWAGQIRGESNGNLSFEVQGRTLAAFSSPRIGLNVLLGADTCAGLMYEATGKPMPQGPIRYHEFTRLVPRTIVAESLDSIRFSPGDGFDICWRFTGSNTDMEDQRNWAETTYKIFMAMRHAYPDLPEADQGKQSVSLCFPRGIPARRRARPAVVEMKVGRVLPGTTMPSVGVEVTDEELPLAAEEISLLQKMQPAHVQVRATMGDAAVDVVKAIGCSAVVVVEDASDASVEALRRMATSGITISAVACAATEADAVTRLKGVLPRVPVGGPAAPDFGHRPALRAAIDAGVDFLAWGAAPNMHLDDDETYLENARGIAYQLRTARYLLGRDTAVVGPIHMRPQYPRPQPDPRHTALLGAAYTAGALCALAEGRASAGTFFRAAGVHGLVHRPSTFARPAFDTESMPQVYPSYQVLQAAAAWRGRPLREVVTSDPLRATLLAVDGGMMMVNLTTERQRVRLRGLGTGLPSTDRAAIRTFDPDTFDAIRRGKTVPPQLAAISRGRIDLELAPCATVVVTPASVESHPDA